VSGLGFSPQAVKFKSQVAIRQQLG